MAKQSVHAELARVAEHIAKPVQIRVWGDGSRRLLIDGGVVDSEDVVHVDHPIHLPCGPMTANFRFQGRHHASAKSLSHMAAPRGGER